MDLFDGGATIETETLKESSEENLYLHVSTNSIREEE